MSNVLSEETKQQVIALGRLGWSLRRIEQQTSVCRKTARGTGYRYGGDGVRPAYLNKLSKLLHFPAKVGLVLHFVLVAADQRTYRRGVPPKIFRRVLHAEPAPAH